MWFVLMANNQVKFATIKSHLTCNCIVLMEALHNTNSTSQGCGNIEPPTAEYF